MPSRTRSCQRSPFHAAAQAAAAPARAAVPTISDAPGTSRTKSATQAAAQRGPKKSSGKKRPGSLEACIARALSASAREPSIPMIGAVDALRLAELLPELPTERTRLLDNLGRVRREVGPLNPELSDALADHMNIRRGEVHEVVSFYSFLDVPPDSVRVCIGPVCDCLGAKEVLAREQEQASGAPVLSVECLGHCELAPVLLRGDSVEPEAVHRANEGPSLDLGRQDATLADYERRGGLSALRSLPENEQIVAELKASGLAGLGGAGF